MTLRYHFIVWWRSIVRLFKDNGLNPLIGIGATILVFALLVSLLYYKLDYPGFIIVGLGMLSTSQFSSMKRDEFLQNDFSKSQFIQLRLLEGIIFAIPFCIALFAAGDHLMGVVLAVISPVLALFSGRQWHFVAIPTPLGRYPFEFTSGIRKYILLVVAIAAIFIIALAVGNSNLAIFSMF